MFSLLNRFSCKNNLYYVASFSHVFQPSASCNLGSYDTCRGEIALTKIIHIQTQRTHLSTYLTPPGHSWHCRSLLTSWYFLSLDFHESLGWALLSFYPKFPVQMLFSPHICPLNIDVPRMSFVALCFEIMSICEFLSKKYVFYKILKEILESIYFKTGGIGLRLTKIGWQKRIMIKVKTKHVTSIERFFFFN